MSLDKNHMKLIYVVLQAAYSRLEGGDNYIKISLDKLLTNECTGKQGASQKKLVLKYGIGSQVRRSR